MKLYQDQGNYLKIPLTTKQIETVLKILPKNNNNNNNHNNNTKTKSPRRDGLSMEYYQPFKEELTSLVLKLLHKMEIQRILSNSLYDTSHPDT